MNNRRLGRTGLKVSEVCLGTMTFGHQCDEAVSFAIMNKAAEHGVYFLDTADVYPVPPSPETAGRTEVIIGKWLKGQRHRFVLATKCRNRVGHGPNDEGLSRRHIFEAVEDSLRRLQTDYIDLYQPHSPDPETPLDETLRALDDLVRMGKVRYLGCSNLPAWQVALALGISAKHEWARLDSVQPRYNLLFRDIEAELLPLCRDQGLGVLAYNPLAGGFLTGRYQSLEAPPPGTRFSLGGVTGTLYRERYWHHAQLEAVRELVEALKPRGRSLIQIAVAWVLAQPGITSAIVGASKPEQLDESLAAVKVKLEADELEACNRAWYRLPRQTATR
jgi:aryl-alcohol dehydrogenase-like predicted oxidoreductase